MSEDVLIPGLAGMDDDQAYRAMDLLADQKTLVEVQEAVFFAVATLLNIEVDVLFFDTTSTYWERDTEDPDEDGADGQNNSVGFRRYGHSKDHRPDLPQIVIGLAVTKDGIEGALLVLAGEHHRRGCAAAGQGRPDRLEAGPGGHGRRPRVLLRSEPDASDQGGGPVHRRDADARRAQARPGSVVPPRPLPRRAGHLRVKEVRLGSSPGVR